MSDIKVHTEADAKTHDVVDKPSQQIINEWATQEGGFVDRPVLEKRLLRKLDLRFSILVSFGGTDVTEDHMEGRADPGAWRRLSSTY